MIFPKPFPHFDKNTIFRYLVVAILTLLTLADAGYSDQDCPQILLQRKHVSGLTFQICQADLINNAECAKQKSEGETCPPAALGIVVRIINQSDTRKMELDGPMRYDLEDNFQNVYNILEAKRIYGQERQTADGTAITSLYPGDFILDQIYFEAPIAAFKSLTLSLNASSAGIDSPVITLPIYKEMIQYPNQVLPPINPYMTVIDIVSPKQDIEVKPGDVVPLQIKLNERFSRPDTLLIIAPNYTFEDVTRIYKYNVRIPDDWPPGRPYQIAIIAKWGRGSDERVASESVTLKVIDPRPCCQNR